MAKKKKATGRPARRPRKASKDETVEVRTAGIGDNSGLDLPAPDDWNHHKKSILGWREKVTTAQSHLRNAIKTAKSAGIDMDAMNMVVGIERTNDPKKAVSFFRQVDLGLENGESTLRLTVHDTLAGDEEDIVYKRGFADGKAGRTAQNDYPEKSSLHSLYAKGWRHGTADNLGVSPEEADRAIEEEQKEAA